uniref:Uncharacterized protein LOC104247998 n=1 Tax=Nicotiana sylvestris TaxID=4096 RepID=A0A1U7YH62_NICSY|nr:PREDICTED: uncharacterized protein LOC104247998 [Nicotiana sylvestris]
MVVPNKASWMVRKIMNMRKNWQKLSTCSQLTKREKFSDYSCYKTLKGTIVNVPWKNLTCHNAAAPKQVFILWLVLLGKLRTKDVLLSWGISVDSICMLCNSYPETSSHIFFECPYSRSIWQDVLSWMKWQRTI